MARKVDQGARAAVLAVAQVVVLAPVLVLAAPIVMLKRRKKMEFSRK